MLNGYVNIFPHDIQDMVEFQEINNQPYEVEFQIWFHIGRNDIHNLA